MSTLSIKFLRVLLFPFKHFMENFHVVLFSVSSKKEVWGVRLYSIRNDANFFRKCEQALALIKTYDQDSFLRIQRFMPNLAHVNQGYNYYNRLARAFYIEDYYPDDVGYFASSIVHEATHAYHIDQGFAYNKTNREKHERIALEEQLSFLSKLVETDSDLSRKRKNDLLVSYKVWFEDQINTRWWERDMTDHQVLKIKSLLGM